MNIKTFTTGYDFATTANAQDMDIIDAQVLEANTNLLNELATWYHLDIYDSVIADSIDGMVQALEPELLIKSLSITQDLSTGSTIITFNWEVQDLDFVNDSYIDIEEDYIPTIASFMLKFHDMQNNEGTYITTHNKGTNTFTTTYTL